MQKKIKKSEQTFISQISQVIFSGLSPHTVWIVRYFNKTNEYQRVVSKFKDTHREKAS